MECPAEGCRRKWEVTDDNDLRACLWFIYAHIGSTKEPNHPDKETMKQLIACYKREQLVEWDL